LDDEAVDQSAKRSIGAVDILWLAITLQLLAFTAVVLHSGVAIFS
jgi:hypothetical protein